MNKRELAELALDLGLDFDKESGIIYGCRRDYAFYLETITDGDEFAIFFSVRCEQGYIAPATLRNKGWSAPVRKPVKLEMWTCISSKEIGSISRHLAMSE